jgi:tetratricopeptide (TPR) repeat protein
MNDSIIFDFDCHKLEDLMFNTMCEYCEDLDLIRTAKKESIGLAERMESSKQQCDVELHIIDILQAFMNASPLLPTELVYEAHCYIGLMWIKCNRTNSTCTSRMASIAAAQCSFTKALWIASSAMDDCSTTTTALSREQVALTMHRLGRLEGERGNYSEAIALVEKAMEKYENVVKHRRQRYRKNESNASKNPMNQQLVQTCMTDARNATSDWNGRLQAAAAAATKLMQTTSPLSCRQNPTRLQRLSFVREETSESSREFQLKH